MSKRVKGIVLACAALLVLVSVLIFLLLTQKDSDDNDTSSSNIDESVQLIEKQPEQVKLIKIKNKTGEYEIIRTGESEWGIDEYKELPLSVTTFSSITNNISSIKAKKLAEKDAPDLEKYGLVNPQAEVNVEFSDAENTSYTFLIGDEAPSNTQYYFCFKGENDVYTVNRSQVQMYLEDKKVYLSLEILEAKSADNYPDIDELNIKGKEWDKPITIIPHTKEDLEKDETGALTGFSEYKMSSPVSSNLDIGKANDYIFGMYGLFASEALTAFPDEQAIKDAGINDPTCVVSVRVGDKVEELIIGKEYEEIVSVPTGDDGQEAEINQVTGYYGMLKGRDIIYKFDTQSLIWVDMTPLSLISRMPFTAYIYDLDSIEITIDDKVHKFGIIGDDEESSFEYDGENLDSQQFKQFFQYLLKGSVEEINDEVPADPPAMTIKYIQRDKNVDDMIVEFYPVKDRKTIISVNGGLQYKAQTLYFERLIENVDNVIEGNDIKMSW